ncbi:hypothetical protein BD410DRAFT_734104, partial [Rickenella mellea]
LRYVQDLVKIFHRNHPSAPQPLAAATFASLPFRPITNFTDGIPSHPCKAPVQPKRGVMS